MAWNPIREVRRSLHEGNLTINEILVPFLAIVIGCNLVAHGAQSFFFEALFFRTGMEVPEHPLVSNDFSQRILSSLGALVPAGVVALLPARIFAPAGRGATVASLVILSATWAFYGAALGAPAYFISGAVVTADPEFGFMVFMVLMALAILLIIGLMIRFWIGVLRGVLGLSATTFALVSVCSVGSLLALVAVMTIVLSPSMA